MRKNIFLLLYFAFCSLFLLPSCLKDEDTILSTDCYISSFSLGTIKRLIHITTSSGKDSTYYVSYDGSYYTMSIDQRNNTICNLDSLPLNSQTTAILATVESSGSVNYRYADETDENWLSYSSSDSIDFSRPLIFRAFSIDGNSKRDYQVKLNVHQQDGDLFTWQEMTTNAPWAEATQIKTIIKDNELWVYAVNDGQTSLFISSLNSCDMWNTEQLNGCENAIPGSLTLFNGCYYMNTADSSLITSTDGINWYKQETDTKAMLLTANNHNIYGIKNGRTIVRSNNLSIWSEEKLDSEATLLPTQDLTALAYTQENGIQRIILAGNRNPSVFSEDTTSVLWSKSIPLYQEEDDMWTYFPWSSANVCPQLKNLNIIEYHYTLIAFGGSSVSGTSHQTLDNMYVSSDNGVTWTTNSAYTLPDNIDRTSDITTAVVDQEYNMWLIAGGSLWKGRLNKLSFN